MAECEEQTSFRRIKENALSEQAKRLLRSDIGIEQTAWQLGFATRAAFHRAFMRWTDTTPGAWQVTLAADA